MLSVETFFDPISSREMTVRIACLLSYNEIRSIGSLASLNSGEVAGLSYVDEGNQTQTMDEESLDLIINLLKSEGLSFGMTLNAKDKALLANRVHCLKEEEEALKKRLSDQTPKPSLSQQAALKLLLQRHSTRIESFKAVRASTPSREDLPELAIKVAKLRRQLASLEDQ